MLKPGAMMHSLPEGVKPQPSPKPLNPKPLPVSANGYFFPFLRSGIEFLGVGKKVVRETPLENPPGPKKYSANHPRNPGG